MLQLLSAGFGGYGTVFWIGLLTGAVLGYVASRIRAVGTQFEGEVWVMVLGTVTGAIVGIVVVLVNVLLATMSYSVSGWMQPREALVITLVVLGVMFAGFVLRRRYR